MTTPRGPRARNARLLIEEVDGDVVVYDLDTDYAHLLNGPTAAVWRLCDGRSVTQLVEAVRHHLGADFGEPVVLDALAQLDRAGLLDEALAPPPLLSRRRLLKTAGIAAVALPLVTTILAPTPAAAASSGAPIGATCQTAQNNGNCACASGNCVYKKGQHAGESCGNTGNDCWCQPCTSATCPGLDNTGTGSPCTSGPTGSTCNSTSGNCN